jgi:SAM-dependent methyltransferase
MSSWLDFWNRGQHRLYVNDRHQQVHYRRVAADVAALIDAPGLVVLDYGPGEALEAGTVAARAGRLILCEAADEIRAKLAERYRGSANIAVTGPADLSALADGSVDLIVVNSVLQYLSEAELDGLLATAHRLLRQGGRLVLADVIPPDSGAVDDTAALLGFAAREGFLIGALTGLASTLFSPYRKIRSTLGLARHAEADLLGRLRRAGFDAERRRPNLGHNQSRMCFVGRRT